MSLADAIAVGIATAAALAALGQQAALAEAQNCALASAGEAIKNCAGKRQVASTDASTWTQCISDTVSLTTIPTMNITGPDSANIQGMPQSCYDLINANQGSIDYTHGKAGIQDNYIVVSQMPDYAMLLASDLWATVATSPETPDAAPVGTWKHRSQRSE